MNPQVQNLKLFWEKLSNVYKNTGENDNKSCININTGIVQNYWL